MERSRSIEVVQKDIESCFAELAELVGSDLTEGEVAEYVRRSQRIRSMAEAQCARSAAALEASQAWVADGARSATAWIGWQCRTSRGRASAAVVASRALRTMPLVEAAFLAGDLSGDHVRLLAAAQAAAPAAFAEGGEAQLVAAAVGLRFTQFETCVRYWCHLSSPDAAEADATRRWSDRRVHCSLVRRDGRSRCAARSHHG